MLQQECPVLYASLNLMINIQMGVVSHEKIKMINNQALIISKGASKYPFSCK